MTQYDSNPLHTHPLVHTLIKIINVDSHEEFLNLLEDKLVLASEKVCSSAKKNSSVKTFNELCDSAKRNIQDPKELKLHLELLEKKLEDDISCQIAHMLDESGFIAEHDPNHNGHVDILVRSQNKKFKWLGEAKLYGGKKYSEKGLYQLVNDYSLGNPNESGGVLIYLNSTQYNVMEVVTQWQEYLQEISIDSAARLKNFTYNYRADYPLIFISEHDHHKTGIKYKIRHCCLDIRIDF
ncbi:hypothetical protein [Acinetobacter sp. GXMZU3951]